MTVNIINFSDNGIRFSMKFYVENHIFEYSFQADGRKCVQIKAKNPKTDKFLKWKLTWEIEKSIKLERPSRSDFDLKRFVKYEKNPTMTHPHFFVTFLLNLLSVKERCVNGT